MKKGVTSKGGIAPLLDKPNMKLLVKKGNKLLDVKDMSLIELTNLSFEELLIMEKALLGKHYKMFADKLRINIEVFTETVFDCYMKWEGDIDEYSIAEALVALIQDEGKNVIDIDTRNLNCMLCDYLPC